MSSDDEDIIELPDPKGAIGQPVAVLMTSSYVGRDDALEILLEGSAEDNSPVRDVAATIIIGQLFVGTEPG